MSEDRTPTNGAVKVMTWDEICAAYPEQWVVLNHLDEDEVSLEIRSANVAASANNRKEAWAKASAFKPGPIAVLKIGEIGVSEGFNGLYHVR